MSTMRFLFSSECEFVVPPPPPASGPPNPKEVQGDIVGVDPPSWEEPNHYMFNFFHYLDVCPHLSVCFCPRHHTIPSQYVIPNMVSGSTTPVPGVQLPMGCYHTSDLHSLQPMSYYDIGNLHSLQPMGYYHTGDLHSFQPMGYYHMGILS